MVGGSAVDYDEPGPGPLSHAGHVAAGKTLRVFPTASTRSHRSAGGLTQAAGLMIVSLHWVSWSCQNTS